MAENLRLKIVLDLAERVLGPLKQIASGSKGAAQALSATRRELRQLKDQQDTVDRLRAVQQQFAATGQQTRIATVMLEQLRRQSPATAAEQRKLAQQVAATEKELQRLNSTSDAQRQRLLALRGSLNALGVGKLADAEAQLRNRIEATNRSMEQQQARLRSLSRLSEDHGRKMMHLGMVGAGGLALQAGGRKALDVGLVPVKDFASHEDAMLGIARQVPGARDEMGRLTEVYRLAEQQVRDLSGQIPLATTEIAAMMTAAARMEVPTDQLKEFTLMASEMATAFDAVPDQVTESMGKVAKNFKIPLTEIRGLADSINYLDDNAISKGADIIGFLNRTSGVVSTVAMSAKDAAALGSTLLTLGEREETASTATNAIVQKLAAATKGTKKFHAALAEIGLKDTAIQKGMATDAMGTLTKVLSAIQALPQEKRIGVMVELVGLEHSDTLAKLVDKPEELTRQRELANGDAGKGSMAREAAARNATLSAQWKTAENRVFNLKAAIGESLKPALVGLMKAVNPLIEGLGSWVSRNQWLVGGVMKLVLGGALLATGLGALLTAYVALAGPMMMTRFLLTRTLLTLGGLPAVAGMASQAFTLIGHAVVGVGRAMLMTPLGAAVAAIAVAALLVYKYWEPLKAFFTGFWDGFKAGMGPTLDALGAALQPLMPVWDQLCTYLGMAWDWFTELLGPAESSQETLNGFANAGRLVGEVIGTMFSPLRLLLELLSKVTALLGPALGWLMSKLPELPKAEKAAVQQAADLPKAPPALAAAAATSTTSNGVNVGRQAPLQQAGTNAVGPQVAGSTHNITINTSPGMDPKAVGRAVSAELDKRERSNRSRVLSSMSDID